MENLDSLLEDLEGLGIRQFEEDLEIKDRIEPEHLIIFRENIKLFRTKDNSRIIHIKGRLGRNYRYFKNPELKLKLCNGNIITIKKTRDIGIDRTGDLSFFIDVDTYIIEIIKNNSLDNLIIRDMNLFQLNKDIISLWRSEQIGLVASIKDPLPYEIMLRIIDKISIDTKELSWYSPWDNKRIYMNNNQKK